MWLRSKEIKQKLQLSTQALYERKKRGLFKTRIVNGITFYWYESNNNEEKINIIYCRVSNTKQKEDLIRQEQILKEFVVKSGNKVDLVFTDISSGMNENRVGFDKVIDLVVEGNVNKLYISYKDRLTRFGFAYFEKLFKKFGTEIVVVNLTKEEDFQQELTQDFISIIHHFSMKMYSNRRKQLKSLAKDLLSENN